MRRFLFLTLLVAFLFFPNTLKAFLVGVEEIQLPNGLKILLLPKKGAPVFSAYIRVKVGGLDEPKGQTGIAHLLEHMAFKGTPNIGSKDYEAEEKILAQIEDIFQKFKKSKGKEKEELKHRLKQLQAKARSLINQEAFNRIYEENGAVGLNATTSQDLTSYFVSLPSHKLELWAYLESERLKNPVFREFYEEKEVVFEERRMRVLDSPLGALYQAMMEKAFGIQGYGRPTIGYPQDLAGLSARDLKKFYQEYYGAKNIVVALVGNFDPTEAKKILPKYFSDLPSGKWADKKNLLSKNPGRPLKVEIKKQASPLWFLGFYRPGIESGEDYALDIIQEILCEGPTSKLYQRLILEKSLVQSVSCWSSNPGVRGENLFLVVARPFSQDSFGKVKTEVFNLFKQIKAQGFQNQDVVRAKKKLKSNFYYDLQSYQSLARALSYYETLGLGWEYLSNYSKKLESVDLAEINQVFQKYFKEKNSVEGNLGR